MPTQTPRRRKLDGFLANSRAAIIVLSGRATGMEYVLDQRVIRLGRGPGVDLAIDDPSLECQHAQLEFVDGSYCLVSVAPESLARLNGGSVTRAELKAGDRFQLGKLRFEYALERRVTPGLPSR